MATQIKPPIQLAVLGLALAFGVLSGTGYVLYKGGRLAHESAKVEQVEPDYPHVTESQVLARLTDPDSAQFRNVHKASFLHYNDSLCGEVNAKNSFGGYTGFRRFIATSDGATVFESLEGQRLSGQPSPAFETLWASTC